MKAAALSEADFMEQVTQLAEIRGWSWVHFRPARTARGWRTPVSGPLGPGWPDLVLVRPGRLVFAELKRDGAKPTPEQRDVLEALADVLQPVEAYCWRPADWPQIEEVLR